MQELLDSEKGLVFGCSIGCCSCISFSCTIGAVFVGVSIGAKVGHMFGYNDRWKAAAKKCMDNCHIPAEVVQ